MSVSNAAKSNNVVRINTDENCILCNSGGATASRFCFRCLAEGEKIEKPTKLDFRNAEGLEIDYLLAPELARIGRLLIKTYEDDFFTLEDAEIDYFWKRKGGTTGAKNTLGKCVKVSGPLVYYSEKDFLIWLAADHCYSFNYFKLTATVFHELKHAYMDLAEQKAEIVDHDFEGFGREIEIFGKWRADAEIMGAAFDRIRQPSLFTK